MININLSPNTFKGYVRTALKIMLMPNKWLKGIDVSKFSMKLEDFLGGKIYLMNSGREALFLILQAMKEVMQFEVGDEVLLQGFTCMVVVNSIRWNGFKPVYCDIDEKFNIDLESLKKKISKRTKVLIVQHTFGVGAEIAKIKQFCKEKGILLIEDCAHSLGARVDVLGKERMLGSFGDAAIYSFGRSKVISSVNGGAVLLNNSKFKRKMDEIYEKLKFPKKKVIWQSLMHPVIAGLARRLEGVFGVGKVLIVLAQRFGLISLEVSDFEKKGLMPKIYPLKMANGNAILGYESFKILEKMNRKRKEIVEFYDKNLKEFVSKSTMRKLPNMYNSNGAIWLRYPILVGSEEKFKIMNLAKQKGIVLGDWYLAPIAPKDINWEATKYKFGDCLRAEEICKRVINLPTMYWLKKKDLVKIVSFLNEFQV